MNRPLLQNIRTTLIDLSRAMKESDAPRMVASMETLDAILRDPGGAIPPRLVHFLQQRSYAKASAWLDEQMALAAGDSLPDSQAQGPRDS